MSVSSVSVWEVRTTGNDTNGGGFDISVTSAGTDFSQQDSKNTTGSNISTTDAVANGSSTITSATASFTAALKGNIIYLAGGSGSITGQWREVQSVNSSTSITLDSSIATSTGMTMNIGGALATIGQANTNSVDGNEIHIKAGTYTLTAAISVNKHLAFYGYQSARLDYGTKPLITTATNSINLFQSSGASSKQISFSNLSLSNTATTRAQAVSPAGGGRFAFAACLFDGFAGAVYATSGPDALYFYACEVKNCTSSPLGFYVGNSSQVSEVVDCYIHDNTGDGITFPNVGNSFSGGLTVIRSVIVNNTGKGINLSTGGGTRIFLAENTIANNSGDGVSMTNQSQQQMVVISNIFYGNGGVGLNYTWNNGGGSNSNKYNPLMNRNNAYGANSGGAVGAGITTGINAVTLTADPFTSASGRDYTLNGSAGGGAACKQAGYQWGA